MTERDGDGSPHEASDAPPPGAVERTTATTIVQAPIERVMAVIRDVAEYPSWVGSVRSAEVLSADAQGVPERVRFTLDAEVVADEYVLRYSWAEDGTAVSWVLESSSLQRSQVGSYRLAPVEDGTEVSYELEVELTVPTIGRVRDRAERRIVGAALSELRRRVEAGR